MMRIGQGFDVHTFGEGDHVMLGGVRVPHTHGVVAHSDGDVVIHALCDAIFGALALGDIGRHFPPSQEQWRNADVTVICEAPKVGPHSLAMREAVAEELRCELGRISIKATTTEKLGFTGRGEGIAAQACVLLVLA